MFNDINNPIPQEIKSWMIEINLSINEASIALGISKRQFSRLLSGETKAKKIHGLAMQMLWLVEENNKDLIDKKKLKKDNKVIKIPIEWFHYLIIK